MQTMPAEWPAPTAPARRFNWAPWIWVTLGSILLGLLGLAVFGGPPAGGGHTALWSSSEQDRLILAVQSVYGFRIKDTACIAAQIERNYEPWEILTGIRTEEAAHNAFRTCS